MLGINLRSLSAGQIRPDSFFRVTASQLIASLACGILILTMQGEFLTGHIQRRTAPKVIQGDEVTVCAVSKVGGTSQQEDDESWPSIRMATTGNGTDSLQRLFVKTVMAKPQRELPHVICAYRLVSADTAYYTAATFSADGRHVVLGSQAGLEVRSWPGMARTESIATTMEHILDLSFSPDGGTLLIAGGSPAEIGSVEVLDWRSRTVLAKVTDHTDVVYQVAWSHQGAAWAAASADGRCTVKEAETRATRVTFNGHSQSVLGLLWLAEGKQIASVSSDQTVRLWDSITGRLLRTSDNHVGSVTRVALRPPQEDLSSDIIATISDDRTVRFWQPAVGRLIRFAKLDSIPRSLLWSRDGDLLYVGCDDGNVRAIRFDDAAVEPSLAALTGPVLELVFCPDTRHLLAAGHGGTRVVDTLKR